MTFETVYYVMISRNGKHLYFTEKGRFAKNRRKAKAFFSKSDAETVCKKHAGFLATQPVLVTGR